MEGHRLMMARPGAHSCYLRLSGAFKCEGTPFRLSFLIDGGKGSVFF